MLLDQRLRRGASAILSIRFAKSLRFAIAGLLAVATCGLSSGGLADAPPELKILNAEDARRYKAILTAQEAGDFTTTARLLSGIENRLLVGHVDFQRLMHPTAYTSKFAELRAWLSRYNDHPEAYRVFSLAIKRRPNGAPEPKRPVYGQEHILALVGEAPERPARFDGPAELLAKDVRRRVRKGDNVGAEQRLFSQNARRILGALQQDALSAEVAMGYFVDGKDRAAYRIASGAAERSGEKIAKAHWAAGLSAYRLGWIERADKHFQANAQAEGARSWRSASGAFWAGRIRLALNDPEGARYWLGVAANHPRTFYGQLALHGLRQPTPFDWAAPVATPERIARLAANPAGLRALALLQIGERWRADQELQPLVDEADADKLRDIIAISLGYGAPRAAVHAAHRLADDFGEIYPAAAYPIAPWRAPAEYKVDRALLFAFMRQESQFNPRAVSPAGARGLMQVLPTTANYILGEERYVRAARDGLFDPAQNINVGARYLRYLLGKTAVNDGLFRLAIAYNGGIGNLGRWQKSIKDNGDPLLFIESIPSRETRRFTARTMANYWIYRQRLGQPTPSRDDVAQGRWPRYRPQD